MATLNEITWVPCISGGGAGTDDDYNVTGATKLDNTVDTGAPTPITAGDASGFSSTPTVAQLNASSGLNQVIGYYNRRAATYNSAFGTSLATMSYVASTTRVHAGDFTTVLTNINTLRTTEGFTGGSLSFPNSTPTASNPVYGYHLAYLRKALAISGTIKLLIKWTGGTGSGGATNTTWQANTARGWSYFRKDTTYPGTPLSEQFGDGSSTSGVSSPALTSQFMGKAMSTTGPAKDRFRFLCSFPLPTWYSSASGTASLYLYSSGAQSTLEAFNSIDTYLSNTDDHSATLGTGFNGSAYNTNTKIGSLAAASISNVSYNDYLGAITTSALNARAGSWASMIMSTDVEFAGGGVTSGSHSTLDLSGLNDSFNGVDRSNMAGQVVAYLQLTY